jgi:hypothetical protein
MDTSAWLRLDALPLRIVSVLMGVAVLVGSIIAFLKLLMFFRARDMRAFAARWAFQYVGPPALRWFEMARWRSPSLQRGTLPAWFSRRSYPANAIKQVWNVIEGQHCGLPVLIFDSVMDSASTGQSRYCTYVAVLSAQNVFGTDVAPERVAQYGNWTALWRFRFIPLPWTIKVDRIEEHLARLGEAPVHR